MKSLIFLFIPFFMFAQNPYPDTLFMLKGKSYPCLITGIDESRVSMIYSNNVDETTILSAVEKLYLENFGIIYSAGKGYTIDYETASSFIEERMEQIEKEILIKDEQARLEAATVENPNNDDESFNKTKIEKVSRKSLKKEFKRWSFGVLYVPYYSGRLYSLVYGSTQNPPSIYQNTANETNMEAQLAFFAAYNFSLTLDVGYQSTYYESRDEQHIRNNNIPTPQDYGSITKEGLKLLDISLGAKYYFKDIFAENVSTYLLAGIGKQLAWGTSKGEALFSTPNPQVTSEDNQEEFMEDLNSPFHFNFGFGAEYFFNNSLSLNSNIRFIYSKISADYESRYIAPNETRSTIIEYKRSEFSTRIGLGLNFYF